MKIRNFLVGVIIMGGCIMPMGRLYAASSDMMKLTSINNKMMAAESTLIQSDEDLDALYNQKAIAAYKQYLGIVLPKEAKFEIMILDKEHLDQYEADISKSYDEEYKQNKWTEEQYKQYKQNLKKEFDGYREKAVERGYTNVQCQYCSDPTFKKVYSTYTVHFDQETGEVVSMRAAMSDKGNAIMIGNKKPSISADTDQKIDKAITDLIQKYHIGGIQTPKVVLRTDNRSIIIIQDVSDANKLVEIELDCADYSLIGFHTENVRNMLEILQGKK